MFIKVIGIPPTSDITGEKFGRAKHITVTEIITPSLIKSLFHENSKVK